ncbi:Shy6-polyketide cyclase [Streptomyces sp. Ru62]|uniref:SRPBCC family protein n=1 Tax=Streptomyces sp. Ru62 TaxID=2080745 RepID=UPI000CDD2F8E|nr:SRPBCC family protein [Streptomyces sp. Ru62]POX60409.1 Shy6-polyketide cyclase [Streptomyces sp. Ru62]
MRVTTAAKFAALTTALVLAASGTAAALTDEGPARTSATAPHTADVHIDESAPVITRDSVLIHAPLHTVWKVQTDVANWPSWQPKVDVVVKETPGRLRPGSVFRWSTEGLDITSTVKQVDYGKRLAWGGPAQGITAVHVWTFTPTSDGVLVHTEESWAGAPVLANQAALQSALDDSLHNWVNNLKHEAETRAAQ